MLVFSVAAGVLGVLARDRALSRQVRDREARILAEFPTIADLLALSVSAGEGPVGSLERVARTSSGELARELNRALVEARTGATLMQALESIADRTSLTPLARFVDGMSAAIERGTPLADVLRAQATDVREAGKRALLEAGSKREIAMMVLVAPGLLSYRLPNEAVPAGARNTTRGPRPIPDDEESAVEPSMPKDMARRYVEALWYSVHTQDASVAVSERFALWWCEHGWLTHRELSHGWRNWYAQNHPHRNGKE